MKYKLLKLFDAFCAISILSFLSFLIFIKIFAPFIVGSTIVYLGYLLAKNKGLL